MSRPRVVRKIQLILGAGLVVLGALLWLSHSRGKVSLQQWKARMTAQGEKFGIDELAPPPAPPDTNLAALIAAADRLRSRSFNPAYFTWLNFSAPGEARPTWMETNLVGGSPRATSTWAQVTSELEAAREDLDAIRAAVQRPADSSATNYRAPMAQVFVQKRAAAQWLAGDAFGQVHAGDLPAAQGNVLALARLSRLHQNDLTIVNQMIRASIASEGFEATWVALQAPGWTETQLAGLQGEWERVAFLEKIPRTIEMERAQHLELFEDTRTNGLRRLRQDRAKWMPGPPGGNFKAVLEQHILDPFWRVAWVEQDELFYLESTQRNIEAMRRARSEKSWLSVSGEIKAIYDGIEARLGAFDSFRYALSGMTLANFSRAWETIMQHETQRSLMITALALQRYQIRHGTLPPELESLTPEFLAAVPVDYMNGKPLRYRLEPDGSYRLYSVGRDGADDGGDPAPVAAWKRYSTFWDGRDAVWPRLAAPKEPGAAPAAEVLQRVQFENAPVPDVIETLARQAGIRVEMDPAVGRRSFPPVTLRFENVTALGVLEAVLNSNRLVMVAHPGTNVVGVTAK